MKHWGLGQRGLLALRPFLLFFPLFLISYCAFSQENQASFDEIAAQARAAREQGDIQQAMELYRQAVHLNAKWPDGWWFLGSLHYAADEYTAAREALTHF